MEHEPTTIRQAFDMAAPKVMGIWALILLLGGRWPLAILAAFVAWSMPELLRALRPEDTQP